MDREDTTFDIDIDNDHITVKWTRRPDIDVGSRYKEFQIRFNYRDISSDTVWAMLRDIEAPATVSDAIMTRIAGYAGRVTASPCFVRRGIAR